MPIQGTQFQNSKDPLKTLSDENVIKLMKAWGRVATGAPYDLVIGASVNMFVNALRQVYNSRREAEARFDEVTAKMKGALMSHYDPVTGVRRGSIFPFDQTLKVPLFVDKDGFEVLAAKNRK